MQKNYLLKNISSLQLDILKLNIHLDIFPSDMDVQKELNENSTKLDVLLKNFNSQFDSSSNASYIDTPEIWTSEPWPLNLID